MPKSLNNGRITESLQRAFQFKGRYQPVLDEVIVPVYQIADPAPRADTPTCVGNVGAAGAILGTDVPSFIIGNSEGSGVLVVITAASIGVKPVPASPTLTIQFRWTGFSSEATPPFPILSVGRRFFRDRRQVNNFGTDDVLPKLFIGSGDRAVFGDQFVWLRVIVKSDEIVAEVAAASQAPPREPIALLPPGAGIILQTDDIADQLIPTFLNVQWLEVPESYTGAFGSPLP